VLTLVAVLAALGAAAAPAVAQRPDTTRAGARRPPRAPGAPADTTPSNFPAGARPPISPRRAFLYSVLVPGMGQSALSRPQAGAIFVTAEALCLAMIQQTTADLREARRHRRDSIYVRVDDSGKPIFSRDYFSDDLVRVRRTHRQDWIAALLFNHFFAGADAFVAAQLWDLPTQVSLRSDGRSALVAAQVRW
jgi:hypothetical protein